MRSTKSAQEVNGTMAAALEPLRSQLPRSVQEREVLRVVATIPASTENDKLAVARDEVLRWARNRAAGQLPAKAWRGEGFETLTAGRTTMATRVAPGDGLLWSLRGDDPDKNVAERIWSTEVSLGRAAEDEDIRLGVRLLVNSTEPQLVIEPAVPGLVRQITDECGLIDGPIPIRTEAHHASSEDHIDVLIEWIQSPDRRLPLIVAAGDEREDDPSRPMIDVNELGRVMCGLAHIVAVPAGLSYRMSDMFGKELAVFHGGVRAYQPGFCLDDDPRAHRLILGHAARRAPREIAAELRRSIARESLRRTQLGHDVLSFAAVRSAATQAQKTTQQEAGADESERLATANEQVIALEKQITDLQGQVDQAWQLSEEESERAETAEKQLFSYSTRVEMLEAALAAAGKEEVEAPIPSGWGEFESWCDKTFAGRLALAPTARRALKRATFEDIDTAVQGIRWLAREARSRFIDGGGTLANIPAFEGVTNAPCGSDEYTFEFQGRRLSAKWHLKNGGNTRQPERCLRIYYTFDDQTQQIVISDMPAHRRTGAS